MTKRLTLLGCSLTLFIWAQTYAVHVVPSCSLTALNVGQGDAILIQTSDHQDILIDGGPDDRVIDELGQRLPAGDRDIELMVLTHPHADHVNGLVAVAERYAIRRALETGLPYQQPAYRTWQAMLQQREIPTDFARAGQRYVIGQATLDVLWPNTDLTKVKVDRDNAAEGGGVNDGSIVLKLHCGGSSAMLMGDASSDIEERILDGGVNVYAALLKVGHHGSRFSTSARFLRSVRPVWALISVGQNNRYHHPHPTTILRLNQSLVHVLRTDEQGAVRLWSDGRGGWRLGLDKFTGLW